MIRIILLSLLLLPVNADAFWARTVRFSGGWRDFNNSTVANMVAWYKADSGPAPSNNGNTITSWADKSVTNNNLTSVGGDAIIYYTDIQNGLPAAYFNGTNYIYGPNLADRAQPYTFFLVFRGTSWSDGAVQCIVDMGATGDQAITKASGNTQIEVYAGTALYGDYLTNNTSYIVSTVLNGASTSVKINNATPVTGNAGTQVNEMRPLIGALNGATNGYIGYVMEWIVYDGAVSTANQDIIRKYLNSKWAIY